MTKQYIRYIFNQIIFSLTIWLCVFVSSTSAINIYDYGIYNDNNPYGSTYRWLNTTSATYKINSELSLYYTCSYNHITVYHSLSDVSSHSIGFMSADQYTTKNDKHTSTHNINNGDYATSGRTVNPYDVWHCFDPITMGSTIQFYPVGTDIYSVSGTTCGLTTVSLYRNNIYINDDDLFDNAYSFEIINNTIYTLQFNNGHEYEFICTNNEVYNYDQCDYQILHYVDDCANLLKNPYIHIIKNDDWTDWLIAGGTSHTDVFMVGTDIQLNDKLDVYIDTDQGTQHRTIYAEIGEDWLYHKTKSWDLDITVYDINTSACVTGAKVTVDQDCRINGYPSCTYGTTNLYGYVKTFDLSNQPYRVKVEKENYNTFGYMTINAGFDAQHTNVPLTIYIQDSTKGDGNGTIGDPPNGGGGGGDGTVLPQTECSILWTDNAGNSITEINDTQDARLYFMASNCSTVLTLESRDISNHVWDVEDSVPLTPLQTGYVQYGAANWTYPETKRYQGRLYSYDCGCDVTDNLKVWDVNDPNITLINNLTTDVRFRHIIGSSYVNPSSPIKITSYAASNNTSLLNINLFLFNETVKVDEISYTFFDYYVNSQFKAISWNPNYQYTEGYRYSIYMYSNDILVNFDTVFANATGDNPFDTGNTLTVKVYDHNSLPLQYSTVYVESWGSIDTGTTNEVIFTGLGDDIYEYRAIKSGYLDRGFSSVTLTADTTVSYILDIIDTEHAIRDIRMADGDIKNMLYPVIFFILIMLLIGVLIDAVN